MKAGRPRFLAFLAFLHCLVILFWLSVAVVSALVWNMNSEDGLPLGDLVLLGVASIVFAMASFVAATGITRQRLWGLRTAVLGLASMTIFGIWAWIDDWYDGGANERQMLTALSIFALNLCIHLLPPVRRAFRAARLETPAPTI